MDASAPTSQFLARALAGYAVEQLNSGRSLPEVLGDDWVRARVVSRPSLLSELLSDPMVLEAQRAWAAEFASAPTGLRRLELSRTDIGELVQQAVDRLRGEFQAALDRVAVLVVDLGREARA
jgi:hypothetical protein